MGEEGGLQRPFVYARKRTLDLETVRVTYAEDKTEAYPILFFVQGQPSTRSSASCRCACASWSTQPAGRPSFSLAPINWGATSTPARSWLAISLYRVRRRLSHLSYRHLLPAGSPAISAARSTIPMRIVDFMVSVPQIPLWMALAGAVPREWPVIRTYFAITLILSIVGWGGLARTVRGKLLSLREEDYIMAARLYGARPKRLIFRYLLPNFMSYLLVNVTISIPGMILGETSLSFLGLGIQPPAVSWGSLLRDVQQLAVVAQRPWQMIPGAFVVTAVLMFNFIGDGLRDAADPYSRI